jgi:hypothetical protein
MAENRLKGQDVQIRLNLGRNILRTITAVDSFTFTYQFAILSKGYLGETTMRKDDIFNGIAGNLRFDQESQDALVLLDTIKRRAQRLPDVPVNETVINAAVTLSFPNGQRPRVAIRGLAFGDSSVEVSSRDAYVGTPLSFEAPDARVITT